MNSYPSFISHPQFENSSHKCHFNRELFPDPLDYYRSEIGSIKARGEWAQGLCPFHDDHNPSFSINLYTGGFRCFSCGAKGSDVLAFQRLKYDQSFKEAAQTLGAWEGVE